MDRLKQVLKLELEKYTGEGANCILMPVFDDKHHTYAVAGLPQPRQDDFGDLVILARIIDIMIIVEEDITDKKLVDALIQQGIPREQIVLAYQGEKLPKEALSRK